MSEFLIWSFQKQAWWKPLRHGYTKHVEEADRFSLEEALEICNNANKHGDEIREGIVPLIEQIELLSMPMGYNPVEDDIPVDIADVPKDLLKSLDELMLSELNCERFIPVTEEYFIEKVGRAPGQDDLDRCNCELAGEDGHFMCGWCNLCDLPRFSCLCADLGESEAHNNNGCAG